MVGVGPRAAVLAPGRVDVCAVLKGPYADRSIPYAIGRGTVDAHDHAHLARRVRHRVALDVVVDMPEVIPKIAMGGLLEVVGLDRRGAGCDGSGCRCGSG